MGRKRRKILRNPKKSLPALFSCPRCGKDAVSVELFREVGNAIVTCGNCGLNDTVSLKPIETKIDAYCLFIDKIYKGS